MARGRTTKDLSTLQMALVGYEFEKQRIEGTIGEIQAMLKGKSVSSPSAGPKPAGVKRILSAAARKRISAAQKKRWRETRKRKAQAAKEA